MRKIIHIDMDAFYASVEQLDNPELLGQAIAVGGSEDRGVVSAASYEARRFGVRSAMSGRRASQLCPHLIFVKPRFARYKEVSREIRAIFERYTDLIEPLSLDEAFLDVTENKVGVKSATFIARAIKTDIKNELNLVASAGVSYNKFLAKMASDEDKPDGLFIIEEKDAENYLKELPVDRFFGVGKVTAEKMKELQLFKGADLMRLSEEQLRSYFGKMGSWLYSIVRGVDNRPVEAHRERKSIACEHTFRQDIFDNNSVLSESEKILDELWKRYRKVNKFGRTLTVKLKYSDFTLRNRSKTDLRYIQRRTDLDRLADELIDQILPLEEPIRLLGFQISGFVAEEDALQLSLELE